MQMWTTGTFNMISYPLNKEINRRPHSSNQIVDGVAYLSSTEKKNKIYNFLYRKCTKTSKPSNPTEATLCIHPEHWQVGPIKKRSSQKRYISMISECIDHGDMSTSGNSSFFSSSFLGHQMYFIQSAIRCIYGLPLADGEVTHADMYHDVEILIVDESGVKVAYPVHLISLCWSHFAAKNTYKTTACLTNGHGLTTVCKRQRLTLLQCICTPLW